MTGRQNFCTSRVQAFCSESVPRPCWANAAVERDADSRVRATRSLRIVFLHSDGRIAPIPDCPGGRRERIVLVASCRGSTALEKAQALANAAKLAPRVPNRSSLELHWQM